MDYPDNVIPHPNAAEPAVANKKIFAADRTLSDHGQHSLSQACDALAIISATDIRGPITFANEQFVKISGYSEVELLGQSHRVVNSGHHPVSFFKEMWQTIVAGETWQDVPSFTGAGQDLRSLPRQTRARPRLGGVAERGR